MDLEQFLILSQNVPWSVSIFEEEIFKFLLASAMLKHVLAIGWALSVCPSVTRWYCVETTQRIVKLSSLPGSPMILVF